MWSSLCWLSTYHLCYFFWRFMWHWLFPFSVYRHQPCWRHQTSQCWSRLQTRSMMITLCSAGAPGLYSSSKDTWQKTTPQNQWGFHPTSVHLCHKLLLIWKNSQGGDLHMLSYSAMDFPSPLSLENKSQYGVTQVLALHLPAPRMPGSLVHLNQGSEPLWTLVPLCGSAELQIQHLYISPFWHLN